MLKVEGLTVFIGDNQVLRGVDLEVGAGQTVAVLGANGAGKSTLIRTILGLLKPRAGRVVLDGQEIQGRPSHEVARLGVACVPEGRRVFADMSVLDNLRMGAFVPAARKVLNQTLGEVLSLFPTLSARLEQRAGTLSGGEQQMLAIGRALMSRPRLLLLDELSLGLAPLVVQGIYKVLSQLGGQLALLLVEQSVEQALRHSQRAYLLETGRIVRQAPSSELLQDDRLKAAYLGL